MSHDKSQVQSPEQGSLDNYSLNDRYTRETGRVFLTGTQALVRLPMMQRQLDRKNNLNTAGFISGYRGSPLGGYDQALWQAGDLLKQHDIDFVPAINEDLACDTWCWEPSRWKPTADKKVDGVFGPSGMAKGRALTGPADALKTW